MSEVSEIDPNSFDITTPNSMYPHGVYVCGCGKMFHGHWNRTAHYSLCPNRLSLLEKAGE